MQVGSLQRASPDLSAAISAQTPASAGAQALAAADKSQDAEQQSSQPPADTSLSNEVQNDSSLPDSLGDPGPAADHCDAACTDMEDLNNNFEGAADACNDEQPSQHDCEEPKQAGDAVLAVSGRQAPQATPQSAAAATHASTPTAGPPSLAPPAELPHISQVPALPENFFPAFTACRASPVLAACHAVISMYNFCTAVCSDANHFSLCRPCINARQSVHAGVVISLHGNSNI